MSDRLRVLAVLPALLVGALGCGSLKRAEEPPPVERLKEMISRAASLSPREFAELVDAGRSPDLTKWPSHPLTLVMFVPVKVTAKRPPTGTDFKLLAADGMANPAKLAETMAPWRRPTGKGGRAPKPSDYASLIRPEYITNCTRTANGDTITGTVFVRAKGVYEATVEYVAGRGPAGWRIEELRMPKSGVSTLLTVRGTWVCRPPAWGVPLGGGPPLEAIMPPEYSEKPEPLPEPDRIAINIRKDGTLVVDGKTLAGDELAEALRQAAKRNTRTPVILRADGDVQYKRVMDVLDACLRAGMTSVSFAATKKRAKKSP